MSIIEGALSIVLGVVILLLGWLVLGWLGAQFVFRVLRWPDGEPLWVELWEKIKR